MELKYREFYVKTAVFYIFRIFAKIRGEEEKSADSGISSHEQPFSLSFLKNSREFSKETLRTGCRTWWKDGNARAVALPSVLCVGVWVAGACDAYVAACFSVPGQGDGVSVRLCRNRILVTSSEVSDSRRTVVSVGCGQSGLFFLSQNS